MNFFQREFLNCYQVSGNIEKERNEDEALSQSELTIRNRKRLSCPEISELLKANHIDCQNLLRIDLSNNNLREFPMEVLKFTKHLKTLCLKSNRIRSLPYAVLSWFPRLESLDLSCNKLAIISEDAFYKGGSSLHTLNLSFNQIRSIPDSISSLKGLRILKLSGNDISSLPLSLASLEGLESLHVTWMLYLKPPINEESITMERSRVTLKTLFAFMGVLKKKHQVVTLFDFLSHFSENYKQTDFTKKDFFGRNILHEAIFRNDLGPCRVFAHAFPQLIMEPDKDGINPFIFALKERKKLFCKMMMSIGAEVNCPAGKAGSALHLAVQTFKPSLCGLFISKGADANALDKDLNLPLHVLFSKFNVDREKAKTIGKMLLPITRDLNAVNAEGMTPLHVAVSSNCSSAFSFCIQHNESIKKSEPNARDNQKFCLQTVDKHKSTIYHLAMTHPNLQIVSAVPRNQSLSPFLENAFGKTCFDMFSFEFLTSKKYCFHLEKQWLSKIHISSPERRQTTRKKMVQEALSTPVKKTRSNRQAETSPFSTYLLSDHICMRTHLVNPNPIINEYFLPNGSQSVSRPAPKMHISSHCTLRKASVGQKFMSIGSPKSDYSSSSVFFKEGANSETKYTGLQEETNIAKEAKKRNDVASEITQTLLKNKKMDQLQWALVGNCMLRMAQCFQIKLSRIARVNIDLVSSKRDESALLRNQSMFNDLCVLDKEKIFKEDFELFKEVFNRIGQNENQFYYFQLLSFWVSKQCSFFWKNGAPNLANDNFFQRKPKGKILFWESASALLFQRVKTSKFFAFDGVNKLVTRFTFLKNEKNKEDQKKTREALKKASCSKTAPEWEMNPGDFCENISRAIDVPKLSNFKVHLGKDPEAPVTFNVK